MKNCIQCGRPMTAGKPYDSPMWVSHANGTQKEIPVTKTDWKCPKGHTVQTWKKK